MVAVCAKYATRKMWSANIAIGLSPSARHRGSHARTRSVPEELSSVSYVLNPIVMDTTNASSVGGTRALNASYVVRRMRERNGNTNPGARRAWQVRMQARALFLYSKNLWHT